MFHFDDSHFSQLQTQFRCTNHNAVTFMNALLNVDRSRDAGKLMIVVGAL